MAPLNSLPDTAKYSQEAASFRTSFQSRRPWTRRARTAYCLKSTWITRAHRPMGEFPKSQLSWRQRLQIISGLDMKQINKGLGAKGYPCFLMPRPHSICFPGWPCCTNLASVPSSNLYRGPRFCSPSGSLHQLKTAHLAQAARSHYTDTGHWTGKPL